MSQIDIYVKAENSKWYRCPVIAGKYTIKVNSKNGTRDVTFEWFIRFDLDCPRLIVERNVAPEKPADAMKVLASTGVSAYLNAGRGKSEGYQSFTHDNQNHKAAIGYEIRVLRAIPNELITKHLGEYDELSGAPDGMTIYKW